MAKSLGVFLSHNKEAGVDATLLETVANYWDGRSDGYCRDTLAELDSPRGRAWKALLLEYAPTALGTRLKVLDAGTGPGFLALIMAGCGHTVTAVDYTAAMLEKARINAAKRHQLIEFKQMDVQGLDFDDNGFDLIITRNLTWNLEQPEKAYGEFHRVLRPGGRLLNFDANWYLYLFDSQLRRAFTMDRQNARQYQYPDHCAPATARIMEAIAEKLPLSRVHRPQWDATALKDTGFKKLIIEFDVGHRVWDEIQKVNHASTPLFMIAAEK
jgi:ubiquinone/menaquinone biosynthesis C-methylase UbiE